MKSYDHIENPSIFKAVTIDIGSNATKMVIMAERKDGKILVEKEFFSVNKIAEGLEEDGLISEASAKRLFESLAECFEIIKESNVDTVELVTTHALRTAKNSKEILNYIKEIFKYEIRIIHTEEECQLTFECVAGDKKIVGNQSTLFTALDIGGGTVDIINGKGSEMMYKETIPCGIVNITEKFFCMSRPCQSDIKSCIDYIKNLAEKSIEEDTLSTGRLVAIGGSAVNLVRILKEIPAEKTEEIHGRLLTKDDIEMLIEGMCALSIDKRKTLIGLEKGRHESIISGGVMLLAFMDFLGVSSVTISTRGLRHVIAKKNIEKNFCKG